MEELAKERGIAARLVSAVRSWPEDVAFHKGRKRSLLLVFLDECAEKDGVAGPVEGILRIHTRRGEVTLDTAWKLQSLKLFDLTT